MDNNRRVKSKAARVRFAIFQYPRFFEIELFERLEGDFRFLCLSGSAPSRSRGAFVLYTRLVGIFESHSNSLTGLERLSSQLELSSLSVE